MPKLLTVIGQVPSTNPTLPVHHANPVATGIEWLLLAIVVAVIVRAFMWMFTTLRRHLKDHELHDREHEPDR
jgi:hypothetical protein